MRRLKREEARARKRTEIEKARAKGIYIRTPPTSSDSEEDVPIPAPLSLNGAPEDSTFVPSVRMAKSFHASDDETSGSERAQAVPLNALSVRGRCPHCLHDVDFDLQIGLKPASNSES